jgi:hypothetical protein
VISLGPSKRNVKISFPENVSPFKLKNSHTYPEPPYALKLDGQVLELLERHWDKYQVELGGPGLSGDCGWLEEGSFVSFRRKQPHAV